MKNREDFNRVIQERNRLRARVVELEAALASSTVSDPRDLGCYDPTGTWTPIPQAPAPTPAQETPQETRPITCCTVPGRGKSRTCAQESLKVVFPPDSDVQCCCPCHAGHPPDLLPPQPVLVSQKITDHPVLVWYVRGGNKTCFKCHEPVSMHSPAPEPREETR